MPALGSAGQSPDELEALYPVAYVLQDLLTTTDVRTRMAQLGTRTTRRQKHPLLPKPELGHDLIMAAIAAR